MKFLQGYRQEGMEKLAKDANVGIATLYRIQNGSVSPTMKTISKIASSLNIPVEDVLVDAKKCNDTKGQDTITMRKCSDCGIRHNELNMYTCNKCRRYLCWQCVPICYRCY